MPLSVRALLVVAVAALVVVPAWSADATSRVLIVVDESVYPEIEEGLETYMDHVRGMLPVEFKVLSDGFYAMSPADIRARLARECRGAAPPVVGAIMVGPIPHAVRGNPTEILTPVPIYYEDFEAQWRDTDNDGYFNEVDNDRTTNATEIWTAWWTPPANEHKHQIKLINAYLDKLDRYYRGEIVGRDGMIFIAGNGNSVEITEAWFVLMEDAMKSTGQKVAKVYSRHGQMPATELPTDGEEYKPEDLERALEQGRYQHVHTLTHGAPNGFYWEQAAIRGTSLDFSKFDDTGANIFTTSGCSNANFRGRNRGQPDYSSSIGNLLVFSPRTITVAYYGATSPQSTGVFAVEHTALYEYLDPERGSYFADGYFRMRNTDICWGTQHYMFRGLDGKALIGDPFARYRPVEPAGDAVANQAAQPVCAEQQ